MTGRKFAHLFLIALSLFVFLVFRCRLTLTTHSCWCFPRVKRPHLTTTSTPTPFVIYYHIIPTSSSLNLKNLLLHRNPPLIRNTLADDYFLQAVKAAKASAKAAPNVTAKSSATTSKASPSPPSAVSPVEVG